MPRDSVDLRACGRPACATSTPARERWTLSLTATMAAAVLALVLAACGGAPASPGTGSEDPGGASQGPGTQRPAVSAAPGASTPPAGPPSSASASASAGAAGGDLCGLLTDAEIEGATGVAVKTKEPPTADVAQINPGCRWALDDDISALTLRTWPTGGLERFNFVYSAAEELPGLGDAARFRGGNIGGNVAAVVGDTMVELGYALPVSTSDARPVVLPLLGMILDRL